jgi:hypothetical protein
MTIDVAPSSSLSSSFHYSVDPVFDVMRVECANSTTITVNKAPSESTNSTLTASLQKVVRGIVSLTNPSANTLYLANSSASSDSFKLLAANSTYFGYLIGDDSQATAKISSINNVNTSIITPLFNTLIVPGTSINFSATIAKAAGGTATDSYSIVNSNKLTFGDMGVIKSKTNEISGSTITKSFTGTLSFSTGYNDTSPVLNLNPSSVIFNNYKINNNSANENTRYGNAVSKYISKRLVLSDGLDAEDLRVFVDAYKPNGTEIEVYAKILNSADGETFDDKDWTPLNQITAAGVFSSVLDANDIREYSYTFKQTPTSTVLAGVGESFGNSTITGSGTSFDTDLVAGELVKIVRANTLTDYDILPVSSASTSTILVLTGNVSFTAAGCTIEKVTNPREAFKYNKNSNIVRYHDANGAAFDTYKYLAIKVVMKSEAPYLVPEVSNIRAIACSV